MIQVCSSCGTRWNVRDRQRAWCPRCQGSLLPPSPETAAAPAPQAGWNRPAPGQPPSAAPAGNGQLPPGYRWIAVRPGSPPPPRPRRRPLGPPPRYDVIPRWTLQDAVPLDITPVATTPSGPPAVVVERVLKITAVLLGVAAAVYLLRYILLLINRSVLLNSALAATAVLLGLLISVAALAAVITCWVVLTRWLIARRAAVFAHQGTADPRPTSALWFGCLVPLVNLFWAPVYVIETATAEGHYTRMRKPILVWWLVWGLSAFVAAFSVATLFSYHWFGVSVNDSAQAVADNTVAVICGYLIAMAAVLATARVWRGFEAKPVERPAHRWVVVGAEGPAPQTTTPADPDVAPPVETTGREPAA
ncbi:DUF4328 domain-containing protein [Mycobacterium sp. ACS4331]|uniref:DUF4328 domain-containing protein n=1 Tax=Mycobacterium sp. ACS4331 TaxID=1834121 RepID=UPI0007FF8E54|nr:DUF4328 domain-containing protein [Mycobacterium sp. ACS4331]OBF11013.1 hypothetical protein A5727_21010 [Mycobacterium sp. ACS4331]